MDHIPRLYFANLPTPLEAMPRLTKALGGPQLFVKRDDLTGLALGGNKTRKLEFLLAEAQTHAARTLITAGAIQSNHCRQTAAAATRFGLDCILVLSGEKPATLSGNLLLDQMLGAEVVWSERETRDRVLQEVFQQAETAGRRPFLIPYGGSSPTGAMGYAVAMQELIEQTESHDVLKAPPDWIVFPSSSGGTQAGLVAGARLTGYRGKILGISVDEPGNVLKERVASLASATAASLGQMFTFEPEEILVDDNYLGGGYGVMGEAEKEALSLFARSEGLLLDPVYTGRAAAGMLDLVRQGYFPSDQTVLFWHTGGTPALFADRYRPN
jgi:D-cysteine desulfhydrase family pyridoxal phosphate-dependent enzyme